MSTGASEWIYEYKFRSRYLNIAVLKGKFKHLPDFADRKHLAIEYKINGHWHTRYFWTL